MASGRKWLPIVVGIAGFVLIVGLGLIASCVYLIRQQVSVETYSRATGAEEFEKLRAKLAGQQALIELPGEDGSKGEGVVHRELVNKPAGGVKTVHMRVWIPREGKLVKMDLPIWALRLMGSQPITFDTGDSGFGGVRLKVTAEEIERRGPGLILDHTERRGERLLVWSE